jgi:hypothetical protein
METAIKYFLISFLLLIVCLYPGVSVAGGDAGMPEGRTAVDPLNTVYGIEGGKIRLKDGLSEISAAPGSAAKVRTSVKGDPVYGDVDGDGEDDAAVVLVHDPGGSGTFYYIGVVLNASHGNKENQTVLIGDRFVLGQVVILNGAVVVRYLQRRPDEPMSAAPTIAKTATIRLNHGRLEVAEPEGAAGTAITGCVIIGHEVRTFATCSSNEQMWIMGISPALEDIKSAYERSRPHSQPYEPVVLVLTGAIVGPPKDGFGTAYHAGFKATRFIQVMPEEGSEGVSCWD